MSQAVTKAEPIEPANALTPMQVIASAVADGKTGPDVLAKLMDMQERWERNNARKAFDAAMADAKGEIGPIAKNRVVDFTSAKGRTNYRHEDLAEIARTVDPILRKNGLSYRFRTTSEVNQPVSVTCIVSHRLGHSEENTLMAGRDESGNKNSIQAVGSTITYLQRYTLKAALGLAATDDDDGRAAGADPRDAEPIDAGQVSKIQALCEASATHVPDFCRYMKIDSLAAMTVKDYPRAIDSLETKLRKQKAGK